VLLGHAVEPPDRRVQQLGVGREADVLGLHRDVDRDPRQVLRPQRATRRSPLQAKAPPPEYEAIAPPHGNHNVQGGFIS
jgi:hypothetical protein